MLLDASTFAGVHIRVRAIGVFWARDEAGPDAEVLSVPAGDPRWDHDQELGDLPDHRTAEIGHFFEIDKAPEPSKSTEVGQWGDRGEAVAEIVAAPARHDAAESSTDLTR